MIIRPFQLPNDLDTMNALVIEGFHYPENPAWNIREDEKQGMIDRLEGAKRMWPLLRFLQFFSPILKDALLGFIAEEDGKPVGLINYMRQRDEPEWYIANVTVLPAHRRKGLARKLVQATLDELHRRNARLAILEVVSENLPAIQLYQSMGFEIFNGAVELDLEAGAAPSSPDLPSGWTLSMLSRFDWQTRFELAKRITPASVATFEPPLERRFRMPFTRPLLGILFERMGGNDSQHFALCEPNGHVTGMGRHWYRTRAGGVNSVELSLNPAHSQMAGALVAHSIAAINRASPGHHITLMIESWQPALIAAAEQQGCVIRFNSHRMGLKLQ